MTESESEIAEFVKENWKNLGLWDYYFEFPIVGGDAVAVEKGQLVGIEFETRPGRYLEHEHHRDPSHAKVKYLITNTNDGVPKNMFPKRLAHFLTKADLERLAASNKPSPDRDSYEKAKLMVEEAVATYLTKFYGLCDCKVKLP